ncbi:Alpha/Beta hydrolase protein [Gongronella butleri]|nr:Alpha/Beta hydrolase protein [Gongronella butleri]
MATFKIQKENSTDVICGILEERDDYFSTTRPRLVLILHGNMGHKDYLFHKLLAESLPYASFRFDFRGNGESTGEAGFANMMEDVADIATVSNYFEERGYDIYALVGHSRGGLAAIKYASITKKPVPHVALLSVRYDYSGGLKAIFPSAVESLEKRGFFEFPVRRGDGFIKLKVTQAELDQVVTWDNSKVVAELPSQTSVLTCHALNDTVAPVYNAAMWANGIANNTLRLLPGDHNFKGHEDELVCTILEYFGEHDTKKTAGANTTHFTAQTSADLQLRSKI